MDRLQDIRAFIAVAEGRSFTAAARRLGVSPAQVSKLVARLEDRLKTLLLARTTRDVALTDAGRAFLERARVVIEDLDALEESVRDAAAPRGLLRVSGPVSFGAVELEGALLDFADAYPEVGVEATFSDRSVNLVDEGYDVAVRITRLSDSSLVARRLSVCRLVTCASPAYLETHGTPRTPEELAGHRVVIDLNARDPNLWDYRSAGVRVEGRLRFAGASPCLAAARRGAGITRAPAFNAAEDLRRGWLRPLLIDFEPEPLPIYAVYPHARHLAAKVRVFVDFLANRYAGEPAWHQGW